MRYAPLLAGFTLLFAALGNTSRAAEPTPEQQKRIEELKKQIADKKAEVAKLEAELVKLDPAKPLDWKLNSVGTLPLKKHTWYVVVRVVAPGEVVAVRVLNGASGTFDDGDPFLVKGVPTAGLIVREPIELKGRFKVTGEYLLKDKAFNRWDGSSVWVIEPTK